MEQKIDERLQKAAERRRGMINKIPESLRDKLKGKKKELEKAVLALKEYAKKDLGEQEL